MPRARSIKPAFFKNEDLSECGFAGRLLFIGLWTIADREGRLEDRPKRIQAEVFPYDRIDINKELDNLQKFGFILRYESEGCRFIQVCRFTKHQNPHYKEVPSVIPAPSGHRDSDVVVGGVPEDVRLRIFERDGNKCRSCGILTDLTLDHIIPRSIGGTNDESNLQTLCRKCNSAKNNRISGAVVQRRSEVGSTSAYHPPPSRADILTPDSGLLTPDSCVSDSSAPPAIDTREVFEAIWKQYPNKDGKEAAFKHFKHTVRTETDVGRITNALANYLTSRRVREGYVKNGSTWFNGWADWENYTETDDGRGKVSGRGTQSAPRGAGGTNPKPGKYAGLTASTQGASGGRAPRPPGEPDASPDAVQRKGA
jgi:hypothetical protein